MPLDAGSREMAGPSERTDRVLMLRLLWPRRDSLYRQEQTAPHEVQSQEGETQRLRLGRELNRKQSCWPDRQVTGLLWPCCPEWQLTENWSCVRKETSGLS